MVLLLTMNGIINKIVRFITCFLSIIVLSACSKKTLVTYGDYYLSNGKNSNSVIRLSEDGVYFENIDFTVQMKEVAKVRANTERMSLHNEGIEMTTEEFKVAQEKYYKELDFEAKYQNQKVEYKTEKDEEEGLIYFFVYDEEEKIDIEFHFDEKQGLDTMYFGDDIYKVEAKS